MNSIEVVASRGLALLIILLFFFVIFAKIRKTSFRESWDEIRSWVGSKSKD